MCHTFEPKKKEKGKTWLQFHVWHCVVPNLSIARASIASHASWQYCADVSHAS